MDPNGLRFWMVADAEQWHRSGTPPGLDYEREHRLLRLASQRPAGRTPALDVASLESEARSLLEKVPQARDGHDTRAYWDPASGNIRATGALPDAIDLVRPPDGAHPTDLVMGIDGVLHVAMEGGVLLRDCRGRWPDVTLSADDCNAWRLASHPDGGLWVLDRAHRTLWRLSGYPLAGVSGTTTDPSRLCACEPNPHPPRLTRLDTVVFPADEAVVGLAASPGGRLALLSWRDGQGLVRLLGKGAVLSPPITLHDGLFPWSLAWVSEGHLAIRLVQLPDEAPVYALPAAAEALPAAGHVLHSVGDLYPLRLSGPPLSTSQDGPFVPGPFVHGLHLPPHYPQQRSDPGDSPRTAPLDGMPLPCYARQGEAIARSAQEAATAAAATATAEASIAHAPEAPSFDSGTMETVWHRLYLEASIPATAGIVVDLAASDDPGAPPVWHEHRFGAFDPKGDGQVPRGVWMPGPSELPFQRQGLLACPPERGRSGLFTVLIQRPGRKVRSLQGRYLRVRVRLLGDGQSTPLLAALRVYASRFSYRDRYLPKLYHETVFGPERDAASTRSTPPDFLERFLAIAEGILTPLEDRIAHTHLLTTPATAPEKALEWLGSWIGVSFDPAYPAERRRDLLKHTPELYRRRGTLAGLERALDVATGGSVTGGEIVVLENFRLRRTFATILGADLADEEDPLLAGLTVSGNSFVGDTLILGEETRKEFLALYRVEVALEAGEREAVRQFFDQLAHRATVFVHESVAPQDLGLIRRVAELETPAHVITDVVTATHPLLVGVASLVGIDTYLAPKPPPRPVRVDESQLSRDFVRSPASLDPRLERGRDEWPSLGPPEAVLAGPEAVEYGSSFRLDASPSRASPGRRLDRYRWEWVE